MSDDIILFPVKNKRSEGDNKFLLAPPVGKCQHLFGPFVVDEKAGKCMCKQCGDEVSAMFVLVRLMREESRWMENKSIHADEMKRLSERSKTKCIHCGKITTISRN